MKYNPAIPAVITETARKIIRDSRPVCPYCTAPDGSTIFTGLPGNACENCMNTGYLDQCPICGGDCAGANPPVYNCPMRSGD